MVTTGRESRAVLTETQDVAQYVTATGDSYRVVKIVTTGAGYALVFFQEARTAVNSENV